MALVTTEAERRRQAAIDLRDKIALEGQFTRSMLSFFREVRNDFRVLYSATGRPIDVQDFSEDLIAILKRQYRRINRRFGNTIRNGDNDLEGDIPNEQIEEQLRSELSGRAEVQSGIILRTTQFEIDAAVARTLSENVEQPLSDPEIAILASESMVARQNARAETIAMTETNAVSENAKLTEAQILAAAGVTAAGIALAGNMVKQWDAILDERTRINHAVADGQRRPINQPFDVGGQQLMHPSDTTLGATADNIINCRCSSQFVLGDPTEL